MPLKLGRNLPKVWRPTLSLDRYLTEPPSAPARPLGQRWESKAVHALRDPLANDTLGDCTCAGILKLDVEWQRNAGDVTSPDPNASDAIALYEGFGYRPGDPSTDQGAEL